MDSLWQSLSMILTILMMKSPKTRCTLARGVVLFLSACVIVSPTYAVNSFSVIPSSQIVSFGEEAVFKCRHPTADRIDWFVNGSSIGRRPPPDIFPSTFQTDNGTTVNTLTIVGHPEYNRTVVVCEAYFCEGPRSELSPEALLVCTEPNTTHPPPGEFVLSPVDQIVAQGQQAVFNCQHSTAHAIGWRLNDVPLLDTSLVGVEARSTSLPGGVLNTLTIEARPEYNLTRIECVATFFVDSPSENTVAVILTIQGPLDAVTNVASTRNPFMITWEPPFSLNLTGVEPDIIYCIKIVTTESDCNSTEDLLVLRDCNVTTNYYTVKRLNPGYTYNITVTPRSNDDNALPGHPSVLEEEFATLLDSSVSVSSITSDNQDFIITIHFDVTGNIKPATYTLSLDAIDGEPDPESFSSLPVTNFVEAKNSVALKTSLPRRRVWNFTAFPNNSTERNQAISDAEELSTHDIQNVSSNSHQQTGETRIFGDFVPGTSATGALIIVYSNELTRYHLALRGDNGRLDTTVPNLPSGTYKVSVFTMEENGVPFERVVKRPMSVDVESAVTQNAPHVIEYELTSHSSFNGVNITCFFLDKSTTDCVVIVHTLNSTLTSSGIMNISSYSFTRSESGNSVSGYIKGVNIQEYQFGVIEGELREDIKTNVSSSNVSVYIATGIIMTTLLIILSSLVLIAIIVLNFLKKRQRFRNYEPSSVEKAENMYITQVELKNTGQSGRNSGAHQPSTDVERVYDELTSPNTVTAQESALNDSMQHEKSQDIKYASLTVACATSGKKLDTHRDDKTNIPDKTKVIYSDIKPDEKNEHSCMEPVQVSSQEEDCTKQAVPVQMPFTVDNLFDQLRPLHDKWQRFGDVMSLSEDLLDEIFTNNEDNESCFRNLLEFYMKAGERKRTWDEIRTFVKTVGDEDLADKIYDIHIQPYTPSKAEHYQPQVHGPFKLQDDGATWSSALEKELPVPLPPSVPEGAHQSESAHQPLSQCLSTLTVEGCNQIANVKSISNDDHVTLRTNKDTVRLLKSYTPVRYCSWPHLGNSGSQGNTRHCAMRGISSPAILLELESADGQPKVDWYSESEGMKEDVTLYQKHCQ